jgi:hypothetical protein
MRFASVALFLLAACGAPNGGGSPAGGVSADARAIEVPNAPPREPLARVPDSLGRPMGVPAFGCEGRRRPAMLKAPERVVVDFALMRPMEDAIRAVRAAGGQVRHRFSVALLRAELDTAAVRRLLQGPEKIASWAWAVPDTARRDLVVMIDRRASFRDTQARELRELGGWVVAEPGSHFLQAIVPDSMIPRLRALPWVRGAEPLGIVCAEDALDARNP